MAFFEKFRIFIAFLPVFIYNWIMSKTINNIYKMETNNFFFPQNDESPLFTHSTDFSENAEHTHDTYEIF